MICYKFGLVGKSLKHSFSKAYFEKKFQVLSLPYIYELFELSDISDIRSLLTNPLVVGLNVTIPYKAQVLKYVKCFSSEVEQIQAANVLVKEKQGWKAYNTDVIGFEQSLIRFIDKSSNIKALVLGNGGASKAVIYVLKKMQIPYIVLARNPQNSNELSIKDFTNYASNYKLWINTTPVGMYPEIENRLEIDFSLATPNHYLYDLIYNPEKTSFILEGEKYGAQTKNGLEMLYLQAEAAWDLWKSWI